MLHVPTRFPRNDIISLTAQSVTYDLAESVGPDLKLGSVFDDLSADAIKDLVLSYGTAGGDARLRELVAARHEVGSADVLVTVGSMQALFLLAYTLCTPDDDVVLLTPVFPNTHTVLSSIGTKVRPVPLEFDDGYRLDMEKLRSQLTRTTKLVCMASPQNPSGVAFSEEEVKAVLGLIEECSPDAFLLVDETYREAAYGRDMVRQSLVRLDERIVSCASFSKCHGAPGIRTGWAITQHKALREQLELGKFNTTISNSRIDDAIAIRILEAQENIIEDRRKHLAICLKHTSDFADAQRGAVDWVRPDAGALCCFRLRCATSEQDTVRQFYKHLRARDLRVGPGTWFGESDHVFRLGFGLLREADFQVALARLSDAVSSTIRNAA